MVQYGLNKTKLAFDEQHKMVILTLLTWSRWLGGLYPVYTMKLARRAGSSSARRAGLMSWLSGHGVILQTFAKLLVERSSSSRRALVERSTSWLDEHDEPARRASASSQLHRVNGVLVVRALDSGPRGREFDSRRVRYQATTLCKLFTPTCMCRCTWSSDWCRLATFRLRFDSHRGSFASNLEQVANLLCVQVNLASYPQRDEK